MARALDPQDKDLTIVIVGADTARARLIDEGLREAGYRRLARIPGTEGLARRLAAAEPDVVLIELAEPDPQELREMFALARAVRRPVVIFVDRSDAAAARGAMEAGVSAYVVDGLAKRRLGAIVEVAVSRFNAARALTHELEEARAALAERKVVERAKGLLMALRKISEDEAYALLRSTAINRHRKLAEVARGVVARAGRVD